MATLIYPSAPLINADVEKANAFVKAAASATIDPAIATLSTAHQALLRDACAELRATAAAANELTTKYVAIAASSDMQPITLAQPAQLTQMQTYIANLLHLLADLGCSSRRSCGSSPYSLPATLRAHRRRDFKSRRPR